MGDKNVLSQMDDLMAELGILGDQAGAGVKETSENLATSGNQAPRSNFLSSGPGFAGQNNFVSSGPGFASQNQSNFVSSGPGFAKIQMTQQSGLTTVGISSQPISLASVTPDGRAVKATGPPCGLCGEMVIGIATNALGKSYHPEHFVCAYCHQPFKGSYIEHEDKLYCDADYNELFSPRCSSCQKPIEDSCITAIGNRYHPDCFSCSGCGSALKGKPYKEEDGEVYCTTCKIARQKRLASKQEICAKCKLPITGEYITLGGQPLHSEHYRCEECGCEFKGKTVHEYEGRLYCYEDYQKQIRNICGSCAKPIVGRSVTALGKVWHPEHFTCTTCSVPFAGSSFREHQGKAYCETHYHQYFGRICVKCNKPVVEKGVDAFGKIYHREHFTCTGCDTLLGKEVLEWDAKPMCFKCYDALPKDVKKRIKQKKHGDKKSANEREKLAKKEAKEKLKQREKEKAEAEKAEKEKKKN